MTSRQFRNRLALRAEQSGLTISVALAAKLETYFALLANWNTKVNLTGMNLEEDHALDRLLIEPLVAVRHVKGPISHMIDIGSGGGSPAIPFALAAPVQSLLMVESRARKSVFLREAVRALEMDATVVTARFEALLAQAHLREAHDLLTVRAVRVEAPALRALEGFVRRGGHLFLFGSVSATIPNVGQSVRNVGSFPLIEALQSKLFVVQKSP